MNIPPKTLYKYISPDRLSVLADGMIRFTQPSALNDPFELSIEFDELFNCKEASDLIKTLDIESIIAQSVDEEISKIHHMGFSPSQLKDIASNRLELIRNQVESIGAEGFVDLILRKSKLVKEELKKNIVESLHGKVGILSLTEDPLSQPMWGNYADSSKGIAIGFSSQHLFFNQKVGMADELRHLRKVIYEDRPTASTMMQIDSDIFVLKSKSWAYELEWRMLLPLEKSQKQIVTNEGDIVHLFNYPRDAVVEIIFGVNTTQLTITKCLECIGKFTKNLVLKKVDKLGRNLILVPYTN